MSAFVRLQPGACASVTITSVNVTLPSLVTTIVQNTVDPLWTFWSSGDLSIRMCGVPIHCFVALALFACPGAGVPVVRVSSTPPTDSVVVACIVSRPGFGDVITIGHVPAPFEIVQVLPAVNEPTCAPTNAKFTTVPFGAAAYEPEPSFTNTCAVNGWVVPTGFVAAGGS